MLTNFALIFKQSVKISSIIQNNDGKNYAHVKVNEKCGHTEWY